MTTESMKNWKLWALATLLVAGTTVPAAAFITEPGTTRYLTVPDTVMKTVGEVFPEASNAGASYVSEVYSPNLLVSEKATVQITFLWEGAGYQNTLGYFTYVQEPDGSVTIKDRNLIFPNASFPREGTRKTGEQVDLLAADGTPRVFEPGEKVGFFIVANGWKDLNEIRKWDREQPVIPAATADENAKVGLGCYTTLSDLNPEMTLAHPDLARHVAMIRMDAVPGFLRDEEFFLTGFEDLNRAKNSDNDFNDVVVIVTSTPETAIQTTEVPRYKKGDPDGDGVPGTADHYPDDPTRAFVTRYPTHGFNVVALEDMYPARGDADFNDAVVAYDYQIVTDAKGNVKDILGNYHLLARGAGYDHALGLHLAGLPDDATGTVQIERFLSGDAITQETAPRRTVQEMVRAGKRIPDIFPSTKAALRGLNGSVFTNTAAAEPERPAASARVYVTFDTAVDATALGAVPYDLYFLVRGSKGPADVHFPGKPGLADRSADLPKEEGAAAFLDETGFPFLIEVPTSWRFPLEQVEVGTAYPDFNKWQESKGQDKADWYLKPDSNDRLMANPLAAYIPTRDWAVGLPTP